MSCENYETYLTLDTRSTIVWLDKCLWILLNLFPHLQFTHKFLKPVNTLIFPEFHQVVVPASL